MTDVTVPIDETVPLGVTATQLRLDRPARSVPVLWPVERFLRRHYGALAVVVIALVVVDQAAHTRADLAHWNWMLVSGFAVWLAALYFGLRLPDRVDHAVLRLADRGVLGSADRSAGSFLDAVHRRARRASLVGASVCVVVLAAAWVWFGWTAVRLGLSPGQVAAPFRPLVRTYLPLVAVELAAAIPVGLFAGRAASYGRLGTRLDRDGFHLRLDPDHLDQVAGLGPIGSLYAFQAMLVAVPAMFVGAWWFLIPLFPGYAPWRSTYAGMFVVTLVCEFAVFVLPMRSFHVLMRDERRRLLREADGHSARFVAGWHSVREPAPDRPAPTGDQLAAVAQRYRSIEAMATWPLDARLRRRLELSNLLLLVPFLAEIAGLANDWQAVLDNLRSGQ